MNLFNYFLSFPSFLRRLSTPVFLIILLGCTFIYEFILSTQGFTVVDEGWALSAYQQLFEHPQAAETHIVFYYNAVIFGALWNSLFGDGGILGFRVMGILCNLATAFVVYLLLRNHFSRFSIFCGCIFLLVCTHSVSAFHHNSLSSLLDVITIFFFYNSITKNKIFMTLFGGFILGINFFSRIVNVSQLSLLFVYIVYGLYTKDLTNALKNIAIAIGGVLLGVLSVVCLMISLGHFDIFLSSFPMYFSLLSSSDSTHTYINILNCYKNDYINIFKIIIQILKYPAIALLVTRIKHPWARCFSYIVLGVLFIREIYSFFPNVYILYAFCFIIFIVYQSLFSTTKEISYLMIQSLCVMLFLPLGSDYGIGTLGNSTIVLSIPLSFGLFGQMINKIRGSVRERTGWVVVFSVFIIVFSINSLMYTMRASGFDTGSRLEKCFLPMNPLANTYTTAENCKKMDEILLALDTYVKEKDTLLCWDCVPMIHYLTHTYPYLNTSWPAMFTSDNVEMHFDLAQKKSNYRPVVLCCKSFPITWTISYPDWDNEDNPNNNASKLKQFHRFLEENNYYTVWDNEIFRIMIPEIPDDTSEPITP